MNKNNKNKRIKIKVNSIIFAILLLMVILFLSFLIYANILPLKYLLFCVFVFAIWLLIVWLIFFFKNKNKSKKRSIAGYVISLFLVTIMLLIFFYLNSTLGFFKGFGSNKYKEENYLVVVLKDGNYNEINDLNNKNIGYVKNDLTKIGSALEQLQEKITIENKEYQEYDNLFQDLFNKKIDSLLVEESYLSVLEENNDYADKIKTIYTISVKTEITSVDKTVNVTKKPFTIYISGIDTYGKISSVSRSDVNMIVTINPTTKQILLVSIPRDFYVQLHGTTGYKDKLTHAGLYGIDTSIETLEDLLNTDVNYYYRVNFSTLQDVVDAIDGVDVYSKYSFTSSVESGGTYRFTKGYNHLNGKQALSFSRERYNLPSAAGGDRGRGENQQAVIDGIVRKMTSSAIITKYTKLLDSLKGKFQTNMNDDDISSLIKMQLKNMAKWNITSYSLTGYDGEFEYTYSYPHQKKYVMHPDEKTVNEANSLINKVINGEMLDSSYDSTASNVKNPTTVTGHSSSQTDTKTSTKPVITLVGESIMTLNVGDTYVEPGAKANDATDGDLTSKVIASLTSSEIDTSKVGTYEIKYNVKNSSGAEAITVIRTIKIVEKTANAEITLKGSSSVAISVGDSYTDAGATAIDSEGNDISSKITIKVNGTTVKSVAIDTSKAGDYTITYSITDSILGTISKERIVKVEKSTTGGTDPIIDDPLNEG